MILASKDTKRMLLNAGSQFLLQSLPHSGEPITGLDKVSWLEIRIRVNK